MLERRDIEQIAKAIGDRNILVLSDEIYSRLLFDGGQHFTIMSVPGMQERTILLDGFSKTYAMTGWRMGYGVMRADLAAQITRLMTNSNSCTASFTQVAGIEAIRGDQSSVDRMRDEFQRRRDVFVAGLNKIKGFSCRMPKGAFYVFPNITQDRMEVEAAGRCAAGAGRRGGTVRHVVRRVRRRLLALQRGELAGEPAAGAGSHRSVDEKESLGFCCGNGFAAVYDDPVKGIHACRPRGRSSPRLRPFCRARPRLMTKLIRAGKVLSGSAISSKKSRTRYGNL